MREHSHLVTRPSSLEDPSSTLSIANDASILRAIANVAKTTSLIKKTELPPILETTVNIKRSIVFFTLTRNDSNILGRGTVLQSHRVRIFTENNAANLDFATSGCKNTHSIGTSGALCILSNGADQAMTGSHGVKVQARFHIVITFSYVSPHYSHWIHDKIRRLWKHTDDASKRTASNVK
jgi:hypothetical protein